MFDYFRIVIQSSHQILFKIFLLFELLSAQLSILSQFELNGSASIINCKCYQLNPDIGNSVGSVWNIYKIDLTQPFDFNYEINVGCNNGQWTGADGLVFALQPLSTSIGISGGEMGLGGVTPSLGVFIDTWQNTEHSDPFNDHISININGDVNHTTSNNLAGPYDLGEIENCQYEPLRISWEPSNSIMNVYFNNNLVLTYSGDLVANVFNGDPLVYWGFTASTGGASNFHQFCIDAPDLTIDNSNLVIKGENCNLGNGSISGLNINGGIAPLTWTWNGNSSVNLDTSNINSGNFDLSVTDGLGCISQQTFIVEDLGSPIIDTLNMTKKEEDCNQQNGSIQNINIISFADSLRYFWNGVITDSLDIYNLSAGEFELVVTDNYNCADTLFIDIIDTNYHDIFIDYSAAILEAEEPITYFETSTDSSISWVWSFGDDSISNMENPTHHYQYGGDFEVCLAASNQFNCFDSTCIEISINPNYIIVPNIFTPNGDKTNDLFKIKGINDEFGLQIFNRWGKLVFNENPYGNQWNGIHNNGNKLSSGVYYYVVTHHYNQIEKAGKFRLIRSFKD